MVVAALAAVAGLAAWGSARGKEWLFSSPTFALERIGFEGTNRASQDELLRLSGLALGDNIFETDLSGAEKAMAGQPWVRAVAVERSYPRTLLVKVVEHEAAALADLGGLYYVSEEGKAFKKLAPGEDGDLPILVGVTRDEYVANEAEIERLFREALEALDVYHRAGLEQRAPVSEVRIDRVEGLTFFCGREAAAVKLGTGDYQDKFSRLDKLLTELSRRGAKAEVIRLDNRARPGWVAVQLAQGGGELQGR